MSLPRTIEAAICAAMRREMATVPNLWIRAMRDQRKDLDNNGTSGGKAYPQVAVAVSGKYYTNNFATWAVDVQLTAATQIEDDPDASQLAEIEDAVDSFMDALCDDSSPLRASFQADIQTLHPSFNIGAILPDSGGSFPSVTDDARVMSLAYVIHFSV